MRLLLDTHAVLWWLLGDEALSERARDAISDRDNTVLVSAVSALEIAIKFRSGKLPRAAGFVGDFEDVIARQGFGELSVSVTHARVAGLLNIPHKDPFDRLLIAQAQSEDMKLVSNEALFDGFGAQRLW